MQVAPADEVFRALADERRRLVVRYLLDEGVASEQEVADYVSAHGTGEPAEALLELRHSTLPMLDEAGLVRYDTERRRVRDRSDGVVEDVLTAVEGT
jgi:DNA-binding transcriptional ArsR family regulator